MMSSGPAVAVTLAYGRVRLDTKVDGAFTVICAAEPAALVRLQKPAPEKLRWLLSMVPSQVPLSASNRLPGPWVGEVDGVGDGLVPPGTARISRLSPGRRVAV